MAYKKEQKTLKPKQKVLLPTLKERQRYVVYCINPMHGNMKDFHNDILRECTSLMGIFDGAKAGMQGVKFNDKTYKGIIRVNNDTVDKLKVCLGMIKKLRSENIVIDSIVDCSYVTGLLNKAETQMNTIKN